MAPNLRTLDIDQATKISDVLQAFESSNQDLLLVDVNSVVTKPHLELLTDYPRTVTTALVAKLKNGETRVGQGRISGATSGYHEVGHGNHTFLGIIRLSQFQRNEIIEILSKVKDTNYPGNTIDLILVALVRAALVVAPAEVAGAPFIRSNDANERIATQNEIAALNDARLRLKLANRANDGFYSVFFLRKISKLFTWLAVRLKMTPNQVTLISFGIGLLSAYEFSKGNFWAIFAGAVLLQLSIIIDCVDGELARYTRQFSQLGAWLDAITDRIKEYLVFFALAYGAAKNGHDLWIPAMGMMLFQTFRHLSDYNFARINKIRSSYLAPIDFHLKHDGYKTVDYEKKSRFEYWSKKAVQFPIGELNKDLIDDQIDSFKSKGSTNRFDWLMPSVLRLLEGAILIQIAVTTDLDRSVIFLLLLAILFSHYDNMYRALQGEKKPAWLSIAGGYIFGRLFIIALWIWFGWSLTILVYYFCILFFIVSSVQWVLSRKAKVA